MMGAATTREKITPETMMSKTVTPTMITPTAITPTPSRIKWIWLRYVLVIGTFIQLQNPTLSSEL